MEPTLSLRPAALPRFEAGHPWLFRESVAAVRGPRPRTGEVVSVVAEDSRKLGRGIYDEGSPLAVRVWTRGEQALDAACLEQRVQKALSLRQWLVSTPNAIHGPTTALRLLHGEGDRTPGWVIDRYDSVGVVRTDGEAATLWFERHQALLERLLRDAGLTTLLHRAMLPRESEQKSAAAKPKLLWGTLPSAPVAVLEHGMPFLVDVLQGQKTGAFLDQRDNRRRVRELAAGRRVLNLFSYAGGFSLAAALGGAQEVVSVDIAHGAHRLAERSFRHAGLDPNRHSFVTADAFQWLEQAQRKGERFDLIVSDPPSFAPNEKSVSKALTAYRRLHRAALSLLAADGLFCAASCSSHLPMTRFLTTLDDASLRQPLSILEQRGAPADHPTLAAFPEGAYLKFVVMR